MAKNNSSASSSWQKVIPEDADERLDTDLDMDAGGGEPCTNGGSLEPIAGGRRREETKNALVAVERWIAELRSAPVGGLREEVKRQVCVF